MKSWEETGFLAVELRMQKSISASIGFVTVIYKKLVESLFYIRMGKSTSKEYPIFKAL